MVSTLLSSVSSTEWLNKNSLEKKKCVGVVAQSVEPLDPLKKNRCRGIGRGFESHRFQ